MSRTDEIAKRHAEATKGPWNERNKHFLSNAHDDIGYLLIKLRALQAALALAKPERKGS